jgi:hypothetical protein
MSKVNFSELNTGDKFSEVSHYDLVSKTSKEATFLHYGSGKKVTLSKDYVESFLTTAETYQDEVKVGKEDKYWTAKQIAEAETDGKLPKNHKVEVGDIRLPGIKTIFESIPVNADVFTACYKKKDAPLTKKEYAERMRTQKDKALDKIKKAATAKKGVAAVAAEVIEELQNNPIRDTVEGELRVLRGYKVQFKSSDGHFKCIDMDLDHTKDPSSATRPVNINTLEWLVYKGTKYIVE